MGSLSQQIPDPSDSEPDGQRDELVMRHGELDRAAGGTCSQTMCCWVFLRPLVQLWGAHGWGSER